MALRVIIAAGGTGGHVFPALALGEEIREQIPDSEILFIGTNRGLEEKVILSNGFRLKTITMSGLSRSLAPRDVLKNLVMPFKVITGFLQSFAILMRFKPDVVLGCGGYVTGPIVFLAAMMGKRTIVQEQNSRPGRTTLFLSRWADEVHLTYEDSKRFFRDQKKLKLSGNPLRKGLQRIDRRISAQAFGLNPDKTTITVIGGSLGAHAVNMALLDMVDEMDRRGDLQVLWQTGTNDYEAVAQHAGQRVNVKITSFIDDMAKAYSCADLLICRAGAMTLSEMTMLGLPAILVPFPFAADNHQEFNALSLVNRGAALMIRNNELKEKLRPVLWELLDHPERIRKMAEKSYELKQPDAAKKIIESMKALIA